MDTSYADACLRLEDAVTSACNRASDALTAKEIADELRRIAAEWERDA